ncbi:MAG: hypothetical protein R3268_12865 [Acidiferrobacterales bacterium]|nr:hypothetical protein [Acidiferrobacterales bacterium]
MKLVQVRECDGQCCRESPRWPVEGGDRCLFLDTDGKCSIKKGDYPVPIIESPTWPGRDPAEVFQETCVNWPQNSPEGRDTGGCCWQWVKDGD